MIKLLQDDSTIQQLKIEPKAYVRDTKFKTVMPTAVVRDTVEV